MALGISLMSSEYVVSTLVAFVPFLEGNLLDLNSLPIMLDSFSKMEARYLQIGTSFRV